MKRVSPWMLGFLLTVSLGLYVFADNWAATYGTTSGDWCEAIYPTYDGGFIVGGNTLDPAGGVGSIDVLLLKLSDRGRVLWQRIYDSSSHLWPRSVLQTVDGGYFLAGIHRATDQATSMEVWAMKLDGEGQIVWDRTYGGDDWDRTYSFAQTSDGGFLLMGCTRSFVDKPMYEDFWVLKLDGGGNVLWERTYGGDRSDRGLAMALTQDGGCVLAGCTASFGARGNDFWLVKLDEAGDVEWGKAYGGHLGEIPYSVQQTVDGGYIMAGTTGSYGAGTDDALVLRLDSNGDILWQRAYGGFATDFAVSARETDIGFVVSGHTTSFGAGSRDLWVFQLDRDGNIAWEKTFGGPGDEAGNSIHPLANGYMIGGYTWSFGQGVDDILLIKIGLDGAISPDCGMMVPSTAEVTVTDLVQIDTDVIVRDTSARVRENDTEVSRGSAISTTLCSLAEE